MAAMDEFKKERESIKNAPLKEKISYFFDYYKIHTIVVLVTLIFALMFIHERVTAKDYVLEAALLNASPYSATDDFKNSFMEYAMIDTDKQDVSFDVSYEIAFDVMTTANIASSEKLTAMIAARQLDVIIAHTDLIDRYAYSDAFNSLGEIFSAEELDALSPYLYYIDRDIELEIEKIDETVAVENRLKTVPKGNEPEKMTSPVPIGIYVDENAEFAASYPFYEEGRIALGFVGDAPHPEIVRQLILYLTKQK
ncbi:MAG: hypothetical protein IJ608_00645 [Lachnospiraceae bacterium]|nr:hypothetical protein [Lachnospiraceae bacterium]